MSPAELFDWTLAIVASLVVALLGVVGVVAVIKTAKGESE